MPKQYDKFSNASKYTHVKEILSPESLGLRKKKKQKWDLI